MFFVSLRSSQLDGKTSDSVTLKYLHFKMFKVCGELVKYKFIL